MSEHIKTNDNAIRKLTGEYKRIETNRRESEREQLERMKVFCKEQDRFYEKQNDLKGKSQRD